MKKFNKKNYQHIRIFLYIWVLILKTNTMSTFKKAKVVMLPTNQKTKYLMVYSDVEKTKGKLILNGLKNDEYKEYQNFYIISDDEIKKGDYILNIETNNIFKADSIEYLESHNVIEDFDKSFYINSKYAKKIIGTTDNSLQWLDESERNYELARPNGLWKCLPQPSQQFIQKFVEEYNRGNIISDVLVEYNDTSKNEFPAFGSSVWLKINPKDNTITIKKVKDSYTRQEVDRMLDEQASKTTAEMLDKFKGYKSREEVIAFGKKVKKYCNDGWKEETLHRVFFEWDKWIEENL